MALNRVWIPSPSRGGRRGSTSLVVIHTAEGARTYQSLGGFFANRANGVSSHTGIDNTVGTVGEYVEATGVAWTQANANGYSVATEICAFAAWDRATWLANDGMLRNTGAWIAEECARFGIPKVKLSAAQAQGGARGVCGHVELGAAGGGHWDPGPGFPWDVVMAYADGQAPAPPGPPPPAGPAPAFPLPAGWYFGPSSGPPESVSGYYGPYGGPGGSPSLREWQARMAARGWAISADGFYGPETQTVTVQFQREKGLSADALIGNQTWAAAWTAPVT